MALRVIDEAGRSSTWASETSKCLASVALQVSNVCASKTHMAHLLLAPFASHLYELAALVKEMQREAEIRGAGLPISSMADMDSHLESAKQLLHNYSGRSSLYLLMCCPDLLCQLKQMYTRLKTTLNSLVLVCSAGDGDGTTTTGAGCWSASLKMRCADEMQALEVSGATKLGPKEQSLHDSLEQGVLDSIVTDTALSIKLAKQIAEALGFSSLESEGFENEVSKLKLEKDGAEIRRRGMAHALYLQQFIVLLEKAISATAAAAAADSSITKVSLGPSPNSSSVVRESADKVHHLKSCSRGGGGAVRDTLVLPLQSFICPITKDVMKDPVQIASGQTYERQAIERWFANGHTTCPTGGVDLANTNMKSNIALKQSIAEWKDINNTIRLDVAEDLMMHSPLKEQQLKSLVDLQALCQEDSLYMYKVASKSLVPLLVRLAESGELELRLHAWSLLGLLAENQECQQLMVKEKVIDLIVRCLARQNDEAAQCVKLMHTLSSNQEVAEKISRAPSAVLFLVTLIQDEHCAENVQAILENLPKSDENVVIMAEANIMKPLMDRLNHGENIASKVLMARTLGRLHMPDSSKSVAASEETIRTLARMAESSREEEREAAVMALESLSCVAAARRGLRSVQGAVGTLLNIMKGVRHSEAAKRGSAATLANFWAAADDFPMNDVEELEDAIRIILELLGPPTPVQVQVCMLQGLLALARCNAVARHKMETNDVFTTLLRLFVASASASSSSSSNSFSLSATAALPPPPPDHHQPHLRHTSAAPLLQLLRCPCLELLACLAGSSREEAARAARSNPAAMQGLAHLIRSDNQREAELLAATSFVASLPSKDADVTRVLLSEPDFLHALIRLFKNHRNDAVVEAAAGALLRFTIPDIVKPSTQLTLAKAGVIQTFVGLLRSGGAVSKERAGRALCNFSKSSEQLSQAAEESAQQSTMSSAGLWACLTGGWRERRKRRGALCPVHGGQCSVEDTFCLVEADAVGALAEVVSNSEGAEASGGGAQAAALMALATLVEQGNVEEGCSVIERAGAWSAIIGLMASSTPQVQEKAAHLCEKLFSVPRYRIQYAARAQMHIITLAQRGPPPLKQLAGRLLRYLDLLQSQSDYFGAASITTS